MRITGAIFYDRKDYIKNSTFIEWIINEFKVKDIKLKLYILDDFYKNRNLDLKCDFVINRTRDFNLSQIFEINNIRVFNNSKITLLGNNKLSAYLFAKENNFAIPELPINPRYDDSVICKPILGHGGLGVRFLEENSFDEDLLYQKFIENLEGDVRFYVINNKIYRAIKRYSEVNFVFNYSLGGEFCVYEYSDAECKYVESMISLLKVDYAGFDFFITKKGKLIFNEIEDVVGSRMLSSLGDNNTIPLFVEHVINSVKY